MSKQQLQCEQAAKNAYVSAMAEVSLFCKILGYPDSQANYLIGDDPHGIVDIMEGYRIFNMTDIHVVLSEYERWMEIYKTNEELRKAVDAWYYYCIDWHNQHSYEEPRWVSVKERLPEAGEFVFVSFGNGYVYRGILNDDVEKIWYVDEYGIVDVTHWKTIITPEQEAERSKGCPNLRSWLAGCPVEGLRDATLEWQTQRERDLQAAHQRVEECKQALEDAIKEEVKLNKF
jgi:hypothetical protein